MVGWFLKLIGVQSEFVEHLNDLTLSAQYPLVFWLGLALLVPVGCLIYRRQQQNLASVPHALRVSLSLTRILVLALMVTVLSGPYVRLDHESEKKPLVAVLFDHSASM